MTLEHHHLYTHAGCLDGSGAAILFLYAGGKPENIHWVRAGEVENALSDCPVAANPCIPILLVDIAPQVEDGFQFLHDRGNYHVIDHHKQAEQFSGRPDWTVSVGNEACGTEMFRHYLVAGGMSRFDSPAWKRFAALIDDNDRWVHKLPMSIELPRLFAFIGQKKFVKWFWDVEERFAVEKESYWKQSEKELLDVLQDSQDERFNYLIKNRFQTLDRKGPDGEGIKIAYIVSGEVNGSELLNLYLQRNIDVDLAVQINFDLEKVSIRSIDRCDVYRFCGKFGGGGHKNAGGHSLPDGLVRGIIERLHV